MPRRKMLRGILGRAREDCAHTQRWSPQEGVLQAGHHRIKSRPADSIMEDRKGSGQLPPRSQPSRSLVAPCRKCFWGLGLEMDWTARLSWGKGGDELIWVCARGHSPRSSSVRVFTR